MIRVRWIGAAGLEFIFQDQVILIDPFLSRNSMKELTAGPIESKPDLINAYLDDLPQSIAAIIVGHTHYDHALDIPFITRGFNGPLIGSQSLETLMSLNDMPGSVTICKGGEQVNLIPDATVTMLLSRHGIIGDSVPTPGEIDPEKKPPLTAGDYRLGTIFLAKLALDGITFMMAGSANFVPESLTDQTCDVLFMCVPGWQQSPEYATQLPAMAKPKVIIPYHFDNFFVPLPPDRKSPQLPDLDMEGFINTVSSSAPEAEIRIIETFEYTEF